MSFRNLSPQHMFERLAMGHRPSCQFAGSTTAEFSRWKTETLPRVLGCLGDFPPRVPLNPELAAEWEHDGLRKQRWLIDVQQDLSAALLVSATLTNREMSER